MTLATPSLVIHAASDWMRRIERERRTVLSRGGIFCLALRDRSTAGGVMSRERAEAIWERVEAEFAGAEGLGKTDDGKAYLLAKDESRWAFVAALAIEVAVECGMRPHDVGVGVGFSRLEQREQETADVLRLAADASAAALHSGIGFASRSLVDERRERRRFELHQSLDAALSGADALRLIFQPKVDACTGALVGAEALLRFHCPDHGPVSAIEILSVAEECGELERLDRWALGLAVESLAGFSECGKAGVPVSVNVRATTVVAPGFVEFVASTLAAFKVEFSQLELEIREEETVGIVERVGAAAKSLGTLGVSVTLDGFGRNRTTLADLESLHVTALKLDRGIVREMMDDEAVSSLAHGMMHLARVLELSTLAVGIETAEQHEMLRSAGCKTLQGFLFFPPLELDEFLGLRQ